MANLTVSDVKSELQKNYQAALNNYFAGDNKKTMKFLSAVGYVAQSVPKLLECDKESLITAFMKCAELDLYPSSVSGEAYILPYWNGSAKKTMAQFQLGYKGIVTLLYKAGTTAIYSDIVKKNDTIKIISGMEPRIEHEYPLGDRGEPIGVYVWAFLNGNRMFKYMSKSEVEEFKKFSQSASGKYPDSSPWADDKDPEKNMWRKTCLKQLSKMLPMNEDIYKAIAEDNKESDIEEYAKKTLREKAVAEGPSAAALLDIPGEESEASEESKPETAEKPE